MGRADAGSWLTYAHLAGADAATIRSWVVAALEHFAGDPEITRVEWKSRGHDVAPGLHQALVDNDPAADVGAFAAYEPSEIILPVAEMLAARVGVDPFRALRWAAIWAVHQAAQAWRNDQAELERLVVGPAIRALLRD